MLNKHHRTESPAWKVVDIYAPSNVKTCWVLQVGESRFVPGGCDECERSDTLVDLNTRREDDGDCARCGAKGASIYFDGCRDSLTLLHFVAIAIFGEAPEETRKCDRCNLVMGHDYFRNDGDDVCAYCLTAAEVIDGKATLIINCVACFAPCMGGLRLRLAPNRSICTDCADLERDSVIE